MSDLKPHIIDLYAGVGGLSLGALRAGFNLALAVEKDKHAMSAHQQNFPAFKHLLADVSLLNGDELMQYAGLAQGDLDGLVGGPPCQGFSIIGHRSIEDPRNNLFTKFFELTAQCRPKFFVVENVIGILDKQYDDIRHNSFSFIKDDYILLEPMKLKASDFGVPTSRERVFFVGYRSDAVEMLSYRDFESQKVSIAPTVGEVLRGLPSHIHREWLIQEQSWRRVQPFSGSPFWNRICGDIPDGVGDKTAIRRYQEEKMVSGCFGTRHSPQVQERYRLLKPGERDRVSKSVRLELSGLCPTLRAGTGADKGSYQAVRPIHPTSARVITPREAARMQGFPDWFQFAPSKWHSFRQIGNSVSPILAEAIFRTIRTHLHPT